MRHWRYDEAVRKSVRLLAALLTTSLVVAAPAPGASGRVVDEQGKPIVKARVCTAGAGGVELCDNTDFEGRYVVPASAERSVRIVARGFLPATVPAVPRTEPVVLARAASLHVRLIDDGSGKPIEKGSVLLKYATGKQLGAFPANSKGVSIATLPPGDVELVGRAAGYRDGGSSVTLAVDRPTEVVVRLTKESTPTKP